MRSPLAASMLLTLTACGGSDDSASERDRGDLRVAWPEQEDAERGDTRTRLMSSGGFEEIAEAFNEEWALPYNLTLRHESCGEVNAFYSASEGSIRMCYELFERVQEVFLDGIDVDSDDPTEMLARATATELIVGTWFFILFHELGHALIDFYDLPVLGMEEDAADQFAAIMLIDGDAIPLALGAALYWAKTDAGMYSDIEYVDAHGLNPQRVGTILCMIKGSDPETYEEDLGELFEFRDCEFEYRDKKDTWDELLEPWKL